jgi:hypothetical protein
MFPKNTVAVFNNGKVERFLISKAVWIIVAGKIIVDVREPYRIRMNEARRANITVDSVGIEVAVYPDLYGARENTITIYDSEGNVIASYEKTDVYAFSTRTGVAILTNDNASAVTHADAPWLYEVHPFQLNKATYYRLASIIKATLSASPTIVY